MTPTEIENIVVRIQADNANFSNQLQSVNSGLQQVARTAEETSRKVDGVAASISSISAASKATFGLVAQGLAAIGIASGGSAFLKDTFSAFSEAEEISIKLTAALEANGRAVESTMADYQAFAKTMQDVTTQDDDAVLSMLRVAESMGLTGEKAKRAAQNAISLAATSARGISAQAAIRMTAGLEQGSTRGLTREFPVLAGIKDKTEAAAKAQELLSKGFDVAKASAQSASGQIKQMNNAIGNLKESFGSVVAQVIAPFVGMIKRLTEWLEQSDPVVKKLVVGFALMAVAIGPIMLLVPALISLAPAMIAVAAVIWGINEAMAAWGVTWEDVIQAATTAFKAIFGFFYNFKENMLLLLAWVFTNWQQVFVNIGNVIVNFVTNSAMALANLAKSSQEIFVVWAQYLTKLFFQTFGEDFPLAVAQGIGDVIKLLNNFQAGAQQGIKAMVMGGAGFDSKAAENARANGEKMASEFVAGAKIFITGAKGFGNSGPQSLGEAIGRSMEALNKVNNPFAGMLETLGAGLTPLKLNLLSPLDAMKAPAKKALDDLKKQGEDTAKSLPFYGDNKAVRKNSSEYHKAISETVSAVNKIKGVPEDKGLEEEQLEVARTSRDALINIRDQKNERPQFEVTVGGAIV